MGHGLIDERGQGRAFDVLNDASDDIALAADRANDDCFPLSVSLSGPLVSMTIAAVAADNCIVDLNNSAKLLNVFNEGRPDLVAHKPSRFVRAEAHVAIDLEGAHFLLADQHQMRNSKPILEILIRIFKNRPGKIREAIASISPRRALRALPNASREHEVHRRRRCRNEGRKRPAANVARPDTLCSRPQS